MDISTLYQLVDKNWKISGESYPALKNITDDDIARNFGVKHMISHIVKSLGKIGAITETADHGDRQIYQNSATADIPAKLINTAIKLAQLLGQSPEDIEAELQKLHN